MRFRLRQNDVAHRSPPRRGRAQFRRGFTLVEVLVVLVILGIAAAMVVPRVTGMGDLQALSAAQTLLADMQYAQNESIVTRQAVTVRFNTGGSIYTLVDPASTPLTHPITKGQFQVDYPNSNACQKVRIQSADFDGHADVTFDALGAPNYAGSVTIGADGHSYRISVAAVTGKITVTPLGS